MKILKEINKIRHIIPDKYKVHIYIVMSLICGCAIEIFEKNNINFYNKILLEAAWIYLFFAIYFMIKSTVIEIKEENKKFNKLKAKWIMKKIENNFPLNEDDIKFIYKIVKKENKSVLHKLKKENAEFKK